MAEPVRIVVAEDSLTVRRYLVDVLQNDPSMRVVGEAENGRRAIELCQKLRPHVLTLDMMMPEVQGLEVTQYIMAHMPTPIVIISASNQRGDLVRAFDAVRAGAVEAVDKPSDRAHDKLWEDRLRSTVKIAARVKVMTHIGPRNAHAQVHSQAGLPAAIASPMPVAKKSQDFRVVAVGTSTGGPGALMELLGNLPKSFPVPILLVIHIGEPFGSAFAEWLGTQSPLPVAYPTHGMPLPATPKVWVAPPDQHMVVEHGRLLLNQAPERWACRPSVDVLFESVAKEYAGNAVGCLLTGMGKDGAQGLLQMRQAGALTLSQDEATSTVYGMPREAALLGAAQEILPLDRFAPTLVALLQGKRGGP